MSSQPNRSYRATIILNTRGYADPVETLEQKLADTLRQLGAEVGACNNLGRHDFVRVTDRNHAGDTYLAIDFSAPATVPAAFHEKVRLDRTVKRVVIESA
jgi:small subunit ribosomal protein S6